MRKQITEYTSPLDALVALTKQLYSYEIKYQTDSADFFVQYQQGKRVMMKIRLIGRVITVII